MTFIEFILNTARNSIKIIDNSDTIISVVSAVPTVPVNTDKTEILKVVSDLDNLLDHYSYIPEVLDEQETNVSYSTHSDEDIQNIENIEETNNIDDDKNNVIFEPSPTSNLLEIPNIIGQSTKKVYWKDPLSETIIYNDIVKRVMDLSNVTQSIKYVNSSSIDELGYCSIFKAGSGIKISDEKCLIDKIYTNNPNCAFISNTVQKSLFKKKIVYFISFSKKGSGFLKITFKNQEKVIHGFYIVDELDYDSESNVSSGIIINCPKNISFWSDDIYLPDKNIQVSYFRITEFTLLSEIYNYFKMCKCLGMKCNIEYSVMVGDTEEELLSYSRYLDLRTRYEDLEYMKGYLNKFEEIIRYISELNCSVLDTTLIFEPYLLFNIYTFHKNSKGNPKKVYCRYTDIGKDNIVDFIRKINGICDTFTLKISHVIGLSENYHKILEDLCTLEDLDISGCLYTLEDEAYTASAWINFFIDPTMDYLTFVQNNSVVWNNDQWMAYLFYIKSTLEKLRTKYFLVDIGGILCNLPCGHPNNVKSISKYTNKPFENHTNTSPNDQQNSASLFFFGESFDEFEVVSNKWDDPNIKISDNHVEFLGHTNLCEEIGIKKLLFGSTINNGVTPSPSYTPRVSDHNYTISKIYEYNKIDKTKAFKLLTMTLQKSEVILQISL